MVELNYIVCLSIGKTVQFFLSGHNKEYRRVVDLLEQVVHAAEGLSLYVPLDCQPCTKTTCFNRSLVLGNHFHFSKRGSVKGKFHCNHDHFLCPARWNTGGALCFLFIVDNKENDVKVSLPSSRQAYI